MGRTVEWGAKWQKGSSVLTHGLGGRQRGRVSNESNDQSGIASNRARGWGIQRQAIPARHVLRDLTRTSENTKMQGLLGYLGLSARNCGRRMSTSTGERFPRRTGRLRSLRETPRRTEDKAKRGGFAKEETRKKTIWGGTRSRQGVWEEEICYTEPIKTSAKEEGWGWGGGKAC